jgi:hypothetical protein
MNAPRTEDVVRDLEREAHRLEGLIAEVGDLPIGADVAAEGQPAKADKDATTVGAAVDGKVFGSIEVKLAEAIAIVDLIFTLASLNQVNELCDGTIADAAGAVHRLLGEVQGQFETARTSPVPMASP